MKVQIVIEDYPFLSNAFFIYDVPLSMQNSIEFGSLVAVPFGPSNNIRVGIIIAIDLENKGHSPSFKQVHQVILSRSPLSKPSFHFLLWVSSYYYYPLSLLFSRSGVFPSKKNIRIQYRWSEAFLKEIETYKGSDRIKEYVLSHPNGFFEDLLLRKMKWKKNSTYFKKLRLSKSLQVLYHASYPKQEDFLKNPFQGVRLLYGRSMENRWKWLSKFIVDQNLEKILYIAPSKEIASKARAYFKHASLHRKIEILGKHSLLKIDLQYSLIFIEDCQHLNYRWSIPFAYSIEKVALARSMEMGVPVIFSGYSPSLFSYFHLKSGLFSHLLPNEKNEKEKTSEITPEMKILSLTKEIREHGFSLVPFSVQRWINKNLEQEKKIFLLINRKGVFNFVSCKQCGYVIKCKKCQIILTSSRDKTSLQCRYCHVKEHIPECCPECGNRSFHFHAPGTQKIEEILSKRFYGKRILRLDQDNFDHQQKNGVDIQRFDLMVGTSLAMDYLEFESIDACVWLGFDNMVNYPGFSAEEDALGLMSRLYEKMISRSEKKTLLIASFSPDSELFRSLKSKHLGQYYKKMLALRNHLHYPPYRDWIQIIMESNDEKHLDEQIHVLKHLLEEKGSMQIKSIKRISSSQASNQKAFAMLFSSFNMLESSPFLCSIIDEYKKNEKIYLSVKVME